MWYLINGIHTLKQGLYDCCVHKSLDGSCWQWSIVDKRKPKVRHGGDVASADKAKEAVEAQLDAIIRSQGITYHLHHDDVPERVRHTHTQSEAPFWAFLVALASKRFGNAPHLLLLHVEISKNDSLFHYCAA